MPRIEASAATVQAALNHSHARRRSGRRRAAENAAIAPQTQVISGSAKSRSPTWTPSTGRTIGPAARAMTKAPELSVRDWTMVLTFGTLRPKLRSPRRWGAQRSSMRPRSGGFAHSDADSSRMPVHHVCLLCDYSREASHATVLDPACPDCGAVLAPATSAPAPAAKLPGARITRARWFERTSMGLVLAPLLLAATKLGWGAAGYAGAGGALLMAALVSFVALAPATRHR